MEYIKTIWKHKHLNEPEIIYSELDENRWEIRKLEIYKNNDFGYATKSIEYNGSGLALIPFESVEEINKKNQQITQCNDEILLEKIEPHIFQKFWKIYVEALKKI